MLLLSFHSLDIFFLFPLSAFTLNFTTMSVNVSCSENIGNIHIFSSADKMDAFAKSGGKLSDSAIFQSAKKQAVAKAAAAAAAAAKKKSKREAVPEGNNGAVTTAKVSAGKRPDRAGFHDLIRCLCLKNAKSATTKICEYLGLTTPQHLFLNFQVCSFK